MYDAVSDTRLSDYRGLVDSVLLREIHGNTEMYQAVQHLPEAGGKRLRPLLTMLVADAFGGEGKAVAPAGAAVEATHTFTLIDDDHSAMDDDDTRRGVEAVHKKFGDDTAILASDYLQAKAFSLLSSTDATSEQIHHALLVLSQAMTEMCEGQIQDMAFEQRSDVTPREYRGMAKKKTGTLYGAAAQLGAIFTASPESAPWDMREFGRELGTAFQMVDDVIDLTSGDIDKDERSDLVNGKETIVTTHARQEGVDVSVPENPTDQELQEAVETLRSVGSIEYAHSQAQRHLDNALGVLERAETEEQAAVDLLERVAKLCVKRTY